MLPAALSSGIRCSSDKGALVKDRQIRRRRSYARPGHGIRSTRLVATVLTSVAVAGLLTLLTPGRSIGQGLPSGDPEALGFDPRRLEAVHELLDHLIQTDSLPGTVLVVARRGQVVTARAQGYADLEKRIPMREDHIFRLASATKIFVSAAALSLYEDGVFQLGAPISTVLPAFAHLRVFDDDGDVVQSERPITVRDLLRHTCGYGYGYTERLQGAYRAAGILTPGPGLDWTHPWTLEEWGDHLAGVPMDEEPGRYFSYGLCHDILGLFLEEASGQTLDALLHERVLQPLGLESTGFWFPDERADRLANVYDLSSGRLELLDDATTSPFREPPRALSGGGGWDSPVGVGGLAASAPDMLRFLQAILDGGALGKRRILGRKTTELFFRNHLAGLESEDSFWPGVGFGLGTAVVANLDRYGDLGSRGTIWWAGSSNVHFWVDPEEELVGVFMTQVRPFGVGGVMARVRRAVYAALVGP